MSQSSIIIFGCLTLLVSTVWMWCPLSISTVSSVSKCPSNNIEWVSAAKRKSCNELARIQNCTKVDNFVYHCVLNEEATMLIELCAPVYYLAGYCARFSEVYKSIINDPGLDCTKFDPPCPPRFQSNESFRYQLCYQNTTGYSIPDEPLHPKQHDITYLLSSGLLAVFAIIDATLFLFLAVGIKFKLIQLTSSRTKEILCKEENDDAEKEIFDDNTKHWLNQEDFTLHELPKLDKRVETDKGKKTDEENTANKINEDLVTTETKDDTFQKTREERETMVDTSTKGRLIIGLEEKVNQSTTPFKTGDYKEADHVNHDAIQKPCPNVEITDGWEDCINDDEEKDIEKNGRMQYRILSNTTDEWCPRKGIEKISDVRDALAEKLHIARKHIFVVNKEEGKILKDNTGIAKMIDRPFEVMIANQNRTLIPGCCTRMSCGHLTPQDALFEWTKVSLLSGINAGRTCPECAKSWGMSELMEKGNMSLDEKIFFEQVFMINYRRTPTQLENHEWLNHGVKTVKGSKCTQKSSVDPIQNIDLSPADH